MFNHIARSMLPLCVFPSIKTILLEYEMISGQAVNFHKLGILFNPNVDAAIQNSISATLGVSKPIDTGIYQGLSLLIGKLI